MSGSESGAVVPPLLSDLRERFCFAANLRAMRESGYDRGEARLLACPACGHLNPDHRWTPPFDCLTPGCDCPSVNVEASEAEVEAAFDEAWPVIDPALVAEANRQLARQRELEQPGVDQFYRCTARVGGERCDRWRTHPGEHLPPR